MLRAVTNQMKYVFIALILLAGLMAYLRGNFSAKTQIGFVDRLRLVIRFHVLHRSGFLGRCGDGWRDWPVLFFLPWLDRSPVKSMRYRPSWHMGLLICFVINFIILGYLGIQAPSTIGEKVAQLGTLLYFGFFLLMPWWTSVGEFKQPPERVNFKPH